MKAEPMVIENVNDDPAVGDVVAARVAGERVVEALEAEIKGIKVEPGRPALTLRLLGLQEQLSDAQDALSRARTEEEGAKRAARSRIAAARKPGQVALDRALLAATEELHALAAKRQRYDAETAALLGFAPPPFVAPGLLALGASITQLRRALDGPPPKVAPPGPPAGMRRIRLTGSSYLHRDRLHHYAVGDVLDLEEAEAKRLLKLRPAVAVEVEAGA